MVYYHHTHQSKIYITCTQLFIVDWYRTLSLPQLGFTTSCMHIYVFQKTNWFFDQSDNHKPSMPLPTRYRTALAPAHCLAIWYFARDIELIPEWPNSDCFLARGCSSRCLREKQWGDKFLVAGLVGSSPLICWAYSSQVGVVVNHRVWIVIESVVEYQIRARIALRKRSYRRYWCQWSYGLQRSRRGCNVSPHWR